MAAADGTGPPQGPLVSYCDFCMLANGAKEAKQYVVQMSATYDSPDDQVASMRKIAEFAGKAADNAFQIAQNGGIAALVYSMGLHKQVSKIQLWGVIALTTIGFQSGTPV